MKRAQKLLRLQELEDDLRETMGAYKQVQAALGDTPALREAQQRMADAEATLTQRRSHQQLLEQEIKDLDAKIKRENDRLYDGSIKSHKEIENVQREVESLQRRRGTLDEQALQGMETVEQARTALAQAKTALQRIEAETREEQTDLTAKEQKLKRYIGARRREREATLGEITPADLQRLRSIQERKGQKGVALLRDSNCSICGVNVSATKIAQMRESDELIICGNCGRILVN
jgi:predicted  nucleic acid-binding Zn-ribbon protein